MSGFKVKNPAGAIEYRNSEILERYACEHDVTITVAYDLFEQLKRFLVASATGGTFSPPSKALDQMWHCFILDTIAYQTWCHDYIGIFIHHKPVLHY